MTKIILADGSPEFVSPRAAREKVASGEATFPEATPMYSTRQIVAEPVKVKRKRRSKAEMEFDAALAAEPEQVEESETVDDEPESV
jgi:hypothetical protein